MADQAEAAAHWDAAYAQGDDTWSWFEKYPGMSLRMLDSAGVSAADALIDVGGGASLLAGALLDRGFGDLTVLDISAAGMHHARDRLGSRTNQVHWLTADVLSWRPQRHYRAWHDRAVFHFLTIDEHRQQYLYTLDTATAPGAIERYRRIARRHGRKKAVVAIGRSILVIICHLLAGPEARYTDLGSDFYHTRINPEHRKRNHIQCRVVSAVGQPSTCFGYVQVAGCVLPR